MTKFVACRQPNSRNGERKRRPSLGPACKNLNVTELTDEQLAQLAAREGSDGPAFVAILERFRQRVWSVCYRLMGNEHDASDAAQEVFVRLFVNRAQVRGALEVFDLGARGSGAERAWACAGDADAARSTSDVVGDEATAPEAVARSDGACRAVARPGADARHAWTKKIGRCCF